jgi:hypothetical protein
MDVQLKIQLGLYGTSAYLSPIRLDVGSIGSTASWAGSYHILAMDRHYDDYIMTGALMSLPPISGFPVAHPYQQLTGKIRAAGVTGNIGECVAALFARRYLSANLNQIAHIKPHRPFHRNMSPDFLMDIGGAISSVFSKVVPKGFPSTWPNWWPVESKARNTDNASHGGRRDALKQLLAYWSVILNSRPSEVGYGLIAVFKYQPTRQLQISLMLPKNQPTLLTELKKGYKNREAILRTFLHEC